MLIVRNPDPNPNPNRNPNPNPKPKPKPKPSPSPHPTQVLCNALAAEDVLPALHVAELLR